jgi:hypothetical protein
MGNFYQLTHYKMMNTKGIVEEMHNHPKAIDFITQVINFKLIIMLIDYLLAIKRHV